MKTYQAMNEKIVGILRTSDQPIELYSAARIEELEARIKEAVDVLRRYPNAPCGCHGCDQDRTDALHALEHP